MDTRNGHLFDMNPQPGPQSEFMKDLQGTELTTKQLHERLVVEDDSPAGELLKAGRNDPCPCGSGKKMKKCCGGPIGHTPTCTMCEVPHHVDARCFPTPELANFLTNEKNKHYMARIGACAVLATCRRHLASYHPEVVESIDAALDDLHRDVPHIEVKRYGDGAELIIHPRGDSDFEPIRVK